MGILQKVIQIFKISELRNKILFVLGIFLIFRLMANIPIPGIDASRLQAFFAQNELLGLLNLFTGGALDNLSIVMLGLGPYITAVIVMQLLTMIFPPLKEMYHEEGEAGRQKFNQYTRLFTVPLASAVCSIERNSPQLLDEQPELLLVMLVEPPEVLKCWIWSPIPQPVPY